MVALGHGWLVEIHELPHRPRKGQPDCDQGEVHQLALPQHPAWCSAGSIACPSLRLLRRWSHASVRWAHCIMRIRVSRESKSLGSSGRAPPHPLPSEADYRGLNPVQHAIESLSQSRDLVGIGGLGQSFAQVVAADSPDSFRNAFDTEKGAMGAHVGDQETHENCTAPQQQKTSSQSVKHIHGATTGEPQINRSRRLPVGQRFEILWAIRQLLWTAERPDRDWFAELL